MIRTLGPLAFALSLAIDAQAALTMRIDIDQHVEASGGSPVPTDTHVTEALTLHPS